MGIIEILAHVRQRAITPRFEHRVVHLVDDAVKCIVGPGIWVAGFGLFDRLGGDLLPVGDVGDEVLTAPGSDRVRQQQLGIRELVERASQVEPGARYLLEHREALVH
jgi:hypothetical protein